MTGLDCLREEMLARGCNKAQVESKTAAIVLDILSNSGTKYTEMANEESVWTELEMKKRKEVYWEQDTLDRLKHECRRLQREVNELEEKTQADNSYIDTFLEEMQKCETAEGRDTMRKAQTYINSISIDTKYDNTAFIIGLASILSNGSVGAIKALRKINPKLPDVIEDNEGFRILGTV